MKNSKSIKLALLAVCALLFLNAQSLAQLPEWTNAYHGIQNSVYWKYRKPHAAYWQQDVHYKINATLIDSLDVIDAEETLYYVNNSPDTLYEVYFHLYQNAFIKGSYLEQLNLANNFKQRFGKYELAGKGTEIENLTVNNQQAKLWLDNTILKVTPANAILPGSVTVITIKFKTYFDDGGNQRRRMKMFKDNWGNKQFNAVHWYPRICVYDSKFKWATDQHLSKEFYGNFGIYNVTLNVPNHFVVDATGDLQNRELVMPNELRKKLDIKNFANKPWDEKPSVVITPDGSTKTWHFVAVNVHDFAWVADPTFRIGEEELVLNNGHKVTLVALAQEPHASGWQDAALFTKKVIEIYSRDFGNYLYPKMICVDARDGMEYPMLTLDGGRSPGYYGLIAHEVGHNWFFGMVGNNETYRASLDEGFTQFLTNWAITDIFGEVKPSKYNPYPTPRMDQTVYWGYLRDAMKWEDMPLNTHSDDFNSSLHHGGGYAHVYYKTATMLYNLQYVLGNKLFNEAMQHYFNQWKLCHPYFEDFRKSIIDYTKVDLNWFFDQWLETTKRIDYKVGSVKKVNGDSLQITFKRKGEMQMPIDFTVIAKDGKRADYYIPNTWFVKETNATVLPKWYGWGKLNQKHTVTVKSPGKLYNVIIDTTYRLADVYQVDNDWRQQPISYFDKGISLPINRRKHKIGFRPDLWYNAVDGVKLGYHWESDYAGITDFASATIWYNSQLLNNYSGNHRELLSVVLHNRYLIRKKTYSYFDFKALDGLFYFKGGVEFGYKKSTFDFYLKMLERTELSSVDYLLFPQEWNAGRINSTINFTQRIPYQYFKGGGEFKHGIRASFLSDYDFSSYFVQLINHHNVSKFEIHTRLFAQGMQGSNIAPESRLFVAGGNPKDMMDNKYLRSRGFVPSNWLGFGDATNNFQFGGGLNIRGFAGYLMPANINGTQVYMYRGLSGASVNTEIDFDNFINFKPASVANYLKMDLYLFGDAGILYNTFEPGESSFAQRKFANTGLIANAGLGSALTIKKWGNMNKAKPLTIRFDMPLYISNAPFVQPENIAFRWLLGIGRTF